MSGNYTIKSGDNLWKIVRQQYGLTNNTEIANKVNQIIKANNLKHPDTIFAGNTLDLGQAKPVEDKQTGESSKEAKTPQKIIEAKPSTNPIENTEDKSGTKPVESAPPEKLVSSSIEKTCIEPEQSSTNPLKMMLVDNAGSETKPAVVSTATIAKSPADTATVSKTVATPVVDGQTKKTNFGNWTDKCFDSIVAEDSQGNKRYGLTKVEDFDMAGSEFRINSESGNATKANEIYKQRVLKTAQGEIASFDTDGDKMVSQDEQVKGNMADCQKKFGSLTPDDAVKCKEGALRFHMFTNIDNKEQSKDLVDDKEYAAFLTATDSDHNGKITREEYEKTTDYFNKPLDVNPEADAFKVKVRDSYKSLFGYDPAAQ